MSGSGSCGLPAPHRKCRIVGPDGKDVPRGESGELWVSGRSIMKGYYNNPGASRDAFSGEWFKTGDLFRQDSNGYYYLVGRIKDSIRRSGENISAREVEAVAASVPGVLEVAAIGVQDELRGEEVKLCVVLQAGVSYEDVTPARIVEHCFAELASFKVPRYIEYHRTFPKTNSGKIDKQQLRQGSVDSREAEYDRQASSWLAPHRPQFKST
jgi:acyl-CoA synthetase (AMP-forming)/AMP-acid ligase II